MRFPLFVNGAYRSQSPIADDEQTINWYPEPMGSEGATTKMALYPTPGAQLFATVTEAFAGRAAFAMNGRCFFVIGSKFLEVFADGTYTILGDVGAGVSPATICANGVDGDQLFITSGADPGTGGNGYCFNLTTSVLTNVLTNTLMGGMSWTYFESLDDTGSLRISDPADGLTWDVLQFQNNSITPDQWVSLLVTTYGQTWLFGTQSSQVWYNADTDPFPFQPDQSGLIPYGIVAPYSAVEADGAVNWLATSKDGDRVVLSAKGVTPKRISDFALENELASYTFVEDATALTYRDLGHVFYVLSFPREGKTWVFDFMSGLWHRRGTWLSESNTYDAWRFGCHCFAFGKHLMADRETGEIYDVSSSYQTDVGERLIRRVRRSPAVVSDGYDIQFARLAVKIETGLANQSGAGSDPVVMLRLSDDGGKTWGNYIEATAGRVGRYDTEVEFHQLGIASQRVFEVSVLDPIPWRIIDAYVEATVLKPGGARSPQGVA